MRRQMHALAPAPNAAHRAIAELDQSGAVALRVITQNTDVFGENLDPSVLNEAASIARACAVFFAVGTSLQVYPAAGLVALAADSGARLVIVNAERTPYDTLADEVVREPISEALPRLLRELMPA